MIPNNNLNAPQGYPQAPDSPSNPNRNAQDEFSKLLNNNQNPNPPIQFQNQGNSNQPPVPNFNNLPHPNFGNASFPPQNNMQAPNFGNHPPQFGNNMTGNPSNFDQHNQAPFPQSTMQHNPNNMGGYQNMGPNPPPISQMNNVIQPVHQQQPMHSNPVSNQNPEFYRANLNAQNPPPRIEVNVNGPPVNYGPQVLSPIVHVTSNNPSPPIIQNITFTNTTCSFQCPFCRYAGPTRVESTMDSNILCCVILCIIFCWSIIGLILLCCLCSQLNNFTHTHYCRNCGSEVGKRNR